MIFTEHEIVRKEKANGGEDKNQVANDVPIQRAAPQPRKGEIER